MTTSLNASESKICFPSRDTDPLSNMRFSVTEFAAQHAGDSSLHGVDGDIGQKTQPPLIDADQRDIEGGKHARHVEQGTVAPQHDGEIDFSVHLLQRNFTIWMTREMLGGEIVHHHVQPHAHQKIGQFQQRLGDLRRLVFADQRDGLEGGFHDTGLNHRRDLMTKRQW